MMPSSICRRLNASVREIFISISNFERVRVLTLVTALLAVHAVVNASAQAKPADTMASSSAQEAQINKIEATVVDIPMGEKESPLRLNLSQLMDAYNVPGLSMAVIDNYQIVWAKGYGMIGTASSVPVTTKTLFQAGSISKPVAATAALALVQKGKLCLDEDVKQKLKTWKLPENEFTKDEKVTLRRLMSHTGRRAVRGFPVYG